MTEKSGLPWQAIQETIEGRHSVRAFLSVPVSREKIDALLELASRAPSGSNTQPWRVHVVEGDVRDRLVAAACAVFDADPAHSEACYETYYGGTGVEPYLSRKRSLGKAMYGAMGIVKGDTAAMKDQQRRNFTFFGAPVAIVLGIDRTLGPGSWFDCGAFAQTLMLAARAMGLDTCAQAVWVKYDQVVRSVLALPDDEALVCAIALGYRDDAAIDNRFVSDRLPLDAFVQHAGS